MGKQTFAKHEAGKLISMKISETLKGHADKQAKKYGVSFSEYIRNLIVQDTEKEGK